MNVTVAARRTVAISNYTLFDVAHDHLWATEGEDATRSIRIGITSIASRPMVIDRAVAGFTIWAVEAVIFRKVSSYSRHLCLVASPDGLVTPYDFLSARTRDAFIADFV